MKCRRCGYSLAGLAVRLCPECGRPFHPGNPDSYLTDKEDEQRTRLLCWSACLGAGIPLPLTAWLFLSYLVGRLVLGRWPDVNADDPHEMLGVNLMHAVGDCVLLLSPVAIVLGIAALLRIYARSSRWGAISLAIIVASWIVAGALSAWIDVWGWTLSTLVG